MTNNSTLNSSDDLKGIIERATYILEMAGLKGSKLTIALDNIFKHYTGRSVLEVADIHLETIPDKKLYTPAQLAEVLGLRNRKLGARFVNHLLASYSFQYRVKHSWMPLEDGYAYAAICDTDQTEDDGTIIKRLKWTADIIPILKKLLSFYD